MNLLDMRCLAIYILRLKPFRSSVRISRKYLSEVETPEQHLAYPVAVSSYEEEAISDFA